MSGFVPPTAGVFDAPAVSISLNVEWRSFVMGALESLLSSPIYGLNINGVFVRPPAPVWTGDDDAVYAAEQEVEKILNALAKGQNLMALPGMVQMWAGAIAPAGWLLCDGGVYERADYPFLWGVLSVHGSTFEFGETGFKVPFMNGNFVRGADPTSEDEPIPVGSYGGEAYHVLTIDEMPEHTHELILPASESVSVQSGSTAINHVTSSTPYDTEITGGGEPHNNIPSYFALNFIIKT